MRAQIVLGECYAEGGVGGEVEGGITFAPVSVVCCVSYLESTENCGREGAWCTLLRQCLLEPSCWLGRFLPCFLRCRQIQLHSSNVDSEAIRVASQKTLQEDCTGVGVGSIEFRLPTASSINSRSKRCGSILTSAGSMPGSSPRSMATCFTSTWYLS